MIFLTQIQLNSVLIFLFYGIICGLAFSFFQAIMLRKYQKKIIKFIFDIVFYAFLSIFYVFLINFYNLGKFSFVLLLCFISSISITKYVLKNLLVILEKKCYNIFIKLKTLLRKSNTHGKSKKN